MLDLGSVRVHARSHAAQADARAPRHRPDHVEDFEEHGLGDGRVELADVEAGGGGRVGAVGRSAGGVAEGRRGRSGDLLGDGLGDVFDSGGGHFAFFYV